MEENLVWLTIEGLDKVEVLKGLGFEIDEKYNILSLNGKNVRTLDGSELVRVEDVKAVVPGSLAVVTDLSEIEPEDE